METEERSILSILTGVAGAGARRWLVLQHDGWARLRGDGIARNARLFGGRWVIITYWCYI